MEPKGIKITEPLAPGTKVSRRLGIDGCREVVYIHSGPFPRPAKTDWRAEFY